MPKKYKPYGRWKLVGLVGLIGLMIAAGLVWIVTTSSKKEILGCSTDDQDCLLDKTNKVELSFTSTDEKVSLIVPPQSLIVDSSKESSSDSVTIEPTEANPDELGVFTSLGDPYKVSFDKGFLINKAILTVTYSEDKIPENIAEDNLIIVRLDNNQWRPIATEVDTEKNTLTAKRDMFSIFNWGYGPGRQKKGRPTISESAIKIEDLGTAKGVSAKLYKENAEGKKELVESFTTGTVSDGRILFELTPQLEEKINNGQLFVKLWSENIRIDVEDKSGVTYQTDYFVINKDGNVTAIIEDDQTRRAFGLIIALERSAKFWSSVGNTAGGEVNSKIYGAVTEQLPVTWVSKNPTGYSVAGWDEEVEWQQKIDITDFETNQPNPLIHEYAHYITKNLIGQYQYYLLTKEDSNEHLPGSPTHPRNAYKEDIAYFMVSVLNNEKMTALDGVVNPLPGSKKAADDYGNTMNKYQAATDPAQRESLKNEADNYREEYNKFANSFNEDPYRIEGVGANVLWYIYKNFGGKFGGSDQEQLIKILQVISQPMENGSYVLDMEKFKDNWIYYFPEDEKAIENTYEVHSYKEKLPLI